MSPPKRKKIDSLEQPLELPLTDDLLSGEGLWKLRESVVEYRRVVANLESLNGQLLRENNCLKRLCSSVGSLWDVLNEDIEGVISSVCLDKSINPSICASKLVETLLSTQLPFCAKEHAEDSKEGTPGFVVENDVSAICDAVKPISGGPSGKTNFDEDAKEEFITRHLDAFNQNKDRLLTHVKRLEQFLRESAPGRYPSDGAADFPQQLDSERFKNRVLELSSRLLCGSVSELRSDLNRSKVECGKLELEVSRLFKLTADLRHQLSAAQSVIANHEAELERKKSSPDVTPVRHVEATDDGAPVRSVERIEDVTAEMIIGSTLYSRLFDHAQRLDEEVNRLERENTSLRVIVESSAQERDDQAISYMSKYDSLHEDLIRRVEEYESRISPCQAELSAVQHKLEQLTAVLEATGRERDQLLEELQEKDRRLHDLAATTAKISQGFARSSTNGDPDSRLAEYQEQIQNIAQELEEISIAYEEKIRFSEDLLQQLKEARKYRDKCTSVEVAFRSIQDKMNRMMSVYDTHIGGIHKQREEANHRLEAYRKGWLDAFKRASSFEKQRNVSMSALCESQSLYRRCFREKNELLTHLMNLKSQGTLAAVSLSSEALPDSDSSLINVMQENDVLRRRMTCTVCSENFRDQCITKCGHVFCNPCISNNIKSRNRKCPVCKVHFDKSDVQRIFLD
ncbi:hypothetical protein X943_002815 [Babesia divergens]|uniref:E3 ubiquitin protein ligase n=1 Tax=Babesia divergens TaxID=32595 RepID=A0AAD9LIB2_BABDI|nr:hypothetical protein X943_002815 [Babesia divergens]